ncbi:sterol desaturase, partial [Pseudoalteromonas sp. S409]
KADKNQPCKDGIVGQRTSNNPITITFPQWRHIIKLTYITKGFEAKLKILFGYQTSAQQKTDNSVKY